MEALTLKRNQKPALNRSKSAMRRALRAAYIRIMEKHEGNTVVELQNYITRFGNTEKGIRKYVEHIVDRLLKQSVFGETAEFWLDQADFTLCVSLKRDGSLQAYIWGDQCRFHTEAYYILCGQLMAERLNYEGRDLFKILPPRMTLET